MMVSISPPTPWRGVSRRLISITDCRQKCGAYHVELQFRIVDEQVHWNFVIHRHAKYGVCCVDADVGLRYGEGIYPGLFQERVFELRSRPNSLCFMSHEI